MIDTTGLSGAACTIIVVVAVEMTFMEKLHTETPTAYQKR